MKVSKAFLKAAEFANDNTKGSDGTGRTIDYVESEFSVEIDRAYFEMIGDYCWKNTAQRVMAFCFCAAIAKSEGR